MPDRMVHDVTKDIPPGNNQWMLKMHPQAVLRGSMWVSAVYLLHSFAMYLLGLFVSNKTITKHSSWGRRQKFL